MEPGRKVSGFLYLKGCKPTGTFNEMNETYDEGAPSYGAVKYWNRQFKCDRTPVETAPIPGRSQCHFDEGTIQQEAAISVNQRSIAR